MVVDHGVATPLRSSMKIMYSKSYCSLIGGGGRVRTIGGGDRAARCSVGFISGNVSLTEDDDDDAIVSLERARYIRKQQVSTLSHTYNIPVHIEVEFGCVTVGPN